MEPPTVLEIWRLALPSGTQRVDTQGDLKRGASWAHRMAAHPPAFASLEADEVALASVTGLRLLDDRLTLADLMASLGRRGAAAAIIEGSIDSAAVAAADKHGISLFALPDGVDLRTVERDILRLILDREAQLDRRGRELYRMMAAISIGNRGIGAIVQALKGAVRKTGLILSGNFDVLAAAAGDSTPSREPGIPPWLPTSDVIRNWLASNDLDSKSPPCAALGPADGPHQACVAAVVVDGRVRGFVAVVDEKAEPDTLDRLAVERAALVCAGELAKQDAISAAEQRVRGDFLNMLLTSGPAEAEAVRRRAADMGYPLEGNHITMLLGFGDSAPRERAIAIQELQRCLLPTGIDILVSTYEPHVAVMCHTQDHTGLETMAEHAEMIWTRTMAIAPAARVIIGISQSGVDLPGLRRSFRQAEETVTMAQELFDKGGVFSFGELPLYHLLRRLQGSEELEAFRQYTLAALEAYDHDHNAELVTTLEAYFKHFGNVSQTADSLHLHRNSLIYRLERIQDITNFDLDDEEGRFALQLALMLRPFLSA